MNDTYLILTDFFRTYLGWTDSDFDFRSIEELEALAVKLDNGTGTEQDLRKYRNMGTKRVSKLVALLGYPVAKSPSKVPWFLKNKDVVQGIANGVPKKQALAFACGRIHLALKMCPPELRGQALDPKHYKGLLP